MVQRVKRAVIPVAGLGTRMLPATKAIPKELLPIFDRPIIEHVVNEAIAGGITEIILVTRSGKEAIENHFNGNYELEHRLEKKNKVKILGTVKNIIPETVKITSVRQPTPLGLGDAVLCAKHLLGDEPFAVLLPDVVVLGKLKREANFSFLSLVNAWSRTGLGQIMVEQVDMNAIENYGVVDLDGLEAELFESVKIKGLVEKPSPEYAPANLAVVGRYMLPAKILDLLENMDAGVGGEIQLTDALDKLLMIEGVNAFETDAHSFDCGNKRGFLVANFAFGMRDPVTNTYMKEFIRCWDIEVSAMLTNFKYIIGVGKSEI